MKKVGLYALKLTISGGLLYLIFNKIGVSDLADVFSDMNGWLLFAALVLSLLQTCLNAFRWLVVMKFFGVDGQYLPVLRITFISVLVNQGLPSFIGGDALRVYWLNCMERQLKEALYSVLVDRIVALISLTLMMLIGSPMFAIWFGLTSAAEGLLLLTAITAVGISLFLTLPWIKIAIGGKNFFRNLVDVAERTRRLMISHEAGLIVMAQALAIHGISTCTVFLLIQGFGFSLSFWAVLIVIPPVILISAMPISIAGWGVRESAMILALGLIGIPSEIALAVSLITGGLILINGLCGLPLLILGPERFIRGGLRGNSVIGGPY